MKLQLTNCNGSEYRLVDCESRFCDIKLLPSLVTVVSDMLCNPATSRT